MMKKILATLLAAITLVFLLPEASLAYRWTDVGTYEVTKDALPAYPKPDLDSGGKFLLYKGMEVQSSELVEVNGLTWIHTTIRGRSYYIPAIENGQTHVSLKTKQDPLIEDYYGILDMPHRYAVKMTKYHGATGLIETYEKIGDEYKLRHTYEVTYPKEGPKNKYGDLKTVGGPVVRYLYRTTRSSMNGWHNGERFGVYKVSYPMPHDALPWLLEGRMSLGQYNRIPAINQHGDQYYPHPQGVLGADILIHTAAKGSIGCINIKNDEMSFFYHEDLPTVNDKEIIPFIIYDEDRPAPPVGKLF